MATDLGMKAMRAVLVDENFEEAEGLYSAAIDQALKETSEFMAGRSSVRVRLGKMDGALEDAMNALKLNESPGNHRTLGIVLFGTGRYDEAKKEFEKGASLGGLESAFTQWIQKCEFAIAEAGEENPGEENLGEENPAAAFQFPEAAVPLCVKVLTKNDLQKQFVFSRAPSKMLTEQLQQHNVNIPMDEFTVELHLLGRVDTVRLAYKVKDECFAVNYCPFLDIEDRKSKLQIGDSVDVRFEFVGEADDTKLHLYMVKA